MPHMSGSIEIVPDVWWLRGLRGCNVYAVILKDGNVALIDCGTRRNGAAIHNTLVQIGIDLNSVRILLLTHRHMDHVSAAAGLRKQFGLTIFAGSGDVHAGHIRTGRGFQLRNRGFSDLVAVDVSLPMEQESEPVPGIIAIPAPGHTDGSMCYWLPDRDLMFIGDVLLNLGDRMSRPLSFVNDDTKAHEYTLRAIADRASTHGAPGHGAPIIGDFPVRIRELVCRPRKLSPWPVRVIRNPVQIFRFARSVFFGS